MDLLIDTIDLHVHGGPDSIPRKQLQSEIAEEALSNHMRGVVFKSHVRSTADDCTAINNRLGKTVAYSSLVLNDFIGFNVAKVERELKKGIRIVYMPTSSAKTLKIFDKNGEIRGDVTEILKLVAERNVTLATGHLSEREIFLLVPLAKKLGVRKIIVTHPDLDVCKLSADAQSKLKEYGVYFERTCYCALQSDRNFRDIVDNIRKTGVEANIISSDLGQSQNPKPVDGFSEFLQKLLAAGFNEYELGVMTKLNPLKLLNLMDEFVSRFIRDYVANEQIKQKTRYREPVVGFARASNPEFLKLKGIVRPSHKLPSDLLSNAETVIVIFLPFSNAIIDGNASGDKPSKAWSIAYTETNELLDKLTRNLAEELKATGYDSVGVPSTHHLSHAKKDFYDEKELYSDWSQKHVAEIAGVGKTGVNKLLISKYGCAGRLGSLVTALKVDATPRDSFEYCLTKRGIKCDKCIERCPVKAISADFFDRSKCMEHLVKQRKFQEREFKDIIPTQTCGKCCCDVPCSKQIP